MLCDYIHTYTDYFLTCSIFWPTACYRVFLFLPSHSFSWKDMSIQQITEFSNYYLSSSYLKSITKTVPYLRWMDAGFSPQTLNSIPCDMQHSWWLMPLIEVSHSFLVNYQSATVPYSCITMPQGMQQTWLSSAFYVLHLSVGGFISALDWVPSKVYIH